MSGLTHYSGEQLEGALHRAMAAHDMDAVVGLLRAMAVVDPYRAQRLKDAIDFGLRMKTDESDRATCGHCDAMLPMICTCEP